MYFSDICSVYCKEEPPCYKYDKRAWYPHGQIKYLKGLSRRTNYVGGLTNDKSQPPHTYMLSRLIAIWTDQPKWLERLFRVSFISPPPLWRARPSIAAVCHRCFTENYRNNSNNSLRQKYVSTKILCRIRRRPPLRVRL